MLSGPIDQVDAAAALQEPLALLLRDAAGDGEDQLGRARFSGESLPTSLRSFCSAFSRTLHVLRTTRSACSGAGATAPAVGAEHLLHAVRVVDVHLAAEGVDEVATGHDAWASP